MHAWLRAGSSLAEASTPVATATAPPRWKQAVTIWLGFFPVSLLSAVLLQPHLQGVPLVLRTLISTVCVTPLMIWLVLPRVTAALSWWLAGRSAPWRHPR